MVLYSVVAGREDLDLLSAIVTSNCYEEDIPELANTLRVGGFVGGEEKNKHPDWLSFESLNIGDEITIKIVESNKADPPKSEKELSPEDYKRESS